MQLPHDLCHVLFSVLRLSVSQFFSRNRMVLWKFQDSLLGPKRWYWRWVSAMTAATSPRAAGASRF